MPHALVTKNQPDYVCMYMYMCVCVCMYVYMQADSLPFEPQRKPSYSEEA